VIRQIRTVTLGVRSDAAGDGHYHSPRGDRLHNGIDYDCVIGASVLSPVNGVISKLGFPYGDDLSWRYVEVTDGSNLRHRLFYVNPTAKVGQAVTANIEVGIAQDIRKRYPNERSMGAHVHYEIMNSANEYLDPDEVFRNS